VKHYGNQYTCKLPAATPRLLAKHPFQEHQGDFVIWNLQGHLYEQMWIPVLCRVSHKPRNGCSSSNGHILHLDAASEAFEQSIFIQAVCCNPQASFQSVFPAAITWSQDMEPPGAPIRKIIDSSCMLGFLQTTQWVQQHQQQQQHSIGCSQ
jgi:hypothetical protein